MTVVSQNSKDNDCRQQLKFYNWKRKQHFHREILFLDWVTLEVIMQSVIGTCANCLKYIEK